MLWEIVLTTGLVSTILGGSSGAQQLGPIAALGVGSYIALAGLWGSPVSGASMNPARSLGPALVLGNWSSWWAYAVGPVVGGILAVGIAWILRGAGGGRSGRFAAQGTLGVTWQPGAIDPGPRDHGDAGSGSRQGLLGHRRLAGDVPPGGHRSAPPGPEDGQVARRCRTAGPRRP